MANQIPPRPQSPPAQEAPRAPSDRPSSNRRPAPQTNGYQRPAQQQQTRLPNTDG